MDQLVAIGDNNEILDLNQDTFEPIKHYTRKRKIFLVSATLMQTFRGQ